MCRIAGGIDFADRTITADILIEMRDSLSAGGPDSAGIYIDGPVSLAHRRLSIIDLSESGAQPMISGEWVISFNGEIYNFQEVRKELIVNGYAFNTKTDTEVLIKAFDCWGIEGIKKFRGMFAFALWNTAQKKMILCRDRLGVKPLFYYLKDNLFLFASELKAFHKHPQFDKTLNLGGLPHYFQKGYFHEKDCIYKYVSKIPAGSILEIDMRKEPAVTKYWDVSKIYSETVLDNRSDTEIQEYLESLLTSSFQRRMVADVEVGIFLSGGIDSSLVTALLQKNHTKKIRTFTIGFHDEHYNEAKVAKEVAEHLGTNHETLFCTEEEFRKVIPKLPEIYDEPFGDSSAIPTYLVSRLASKSVKVALSGDGGDELFGGYSKYRFVANNAPLILQLPYPLRQLMHRLSYAVSPDTVSKMASLSRMNAYSQVAAKYYKFRQTIPSRNIDDFFEKSSSYLDDKNIGSFVLTPLVKENYIDVKPENILNFLGLKDMISYLPGDILTKVDRASMHVALEAREPFLDPEIVEFSFSLPPHLKISANGESKYILRQILQKYIPKDLINRPKQGFTVPIEKWMRGQLREELLLLQDDQAFFNTFNLNQVFFKKILQSFFASGSTYNPHFLWFVYCLYKWYKKWV